MVLEKQRQELLSLSRVSQEDNSKSYGLEQGVMKLKAEVAEWSKKYEEEAAAHVKVSHKLAQISVC